jgi:hypothetical protein
VIGFASLDSTRELGVVMLREAIFGGAEWCVEEISEPAGETTANRERRCLVVELGDRRLSLCHS